MSEQKMRFIQIKEPGRGLYRYPLAWVVSQAFTETPAKGRRPASCALNLHLLEPLGALSQGGPSDPVKRVHFTPEFAFDSLEQALASVTVVEM